jgi:putative ABC transport system permease protein
VTVPSIPAAPPAGGVRRARRLLTGEAGPGPALALALIALLAAFVATAGPRAVASLQNHALRQTLTSAGAFGISADDSWQLPGSQPLTAGQMQLMGGVMGGFIRPPLVSPAAQRWAGLTLPFLRVLNPRPQAILGGPPVIEVAYRTALAGHARLAAGSLPHTATTSGRTTVVQAAVTAATAARFGLRPGSRILLAPLPSMPATAPSLVLSVTGVLRPAGLSSSFWTHDPALAAPVTLNAKVAGPNVWAAGVLIGPAELAAVQAAYSGSIAAVTWDYPLQTGGLTAAQAPGMLAAMTSLTSGDAGQNALDMAGPPLESPPTLGAGGAGTLSDFIAVQAAVGSTDALLLAGVAAAIAILLLIGAVVLAGAHREELALMRARGASTRQVAARMGGITAGAAGPALVAGVAAGVAAVPDGGNTVSWVLAALVAVIALAAPALLAAWEHRGLRSLAGPGRDDLVIPRRSARRLVIEATAVVIIVGAVIALRLRGLTPGAGVDPYLVGAPVLIAVAAGLIAARVYPVPLRVLLRFTARRRGTVGYLGIARSARSRSVPLLPALALVVAIAVIALGGMVRAAVSSGQEAVSWQQVGADAVVSAAGGQLSIGPAAQSAIASAPGVRRAAAVYVAAPGSSIQGVLLVGSGGGVQAGVVIADPARYAALVADTPWPAFPARVLAPPAHGGAAAGTVPVIASPGVAAAMGTGPRQLAFASSGLTIRVVATAGSTPALPGGGNFLIMPSWASSRLAASTLPNAMLLTGGAINVRALNAVVARVLPGGQVVSRAAVLQAAAGSPAVHGSDLALELSTGAAAACGAAAALLGVLLAGRDRTRLGVWLTAMGMTARQARRLAVLDALPLLLIAVLGGELAGLVLAPLIGPGLDLSAFTGSGAPVQVRPDAVALIAPAAGAVILIIAVAVGQNALIRSRTAGVLRLDEGS